MLLVLRISSYHFFIWQQCNLHCVSQKVKTITLEVVLPCYFLVIRSYSLVGCSCFSLCSFVIIVCLQYSGVLQRPMCLHHVLWMEPYGTHVIVSTQPSLSRPLTLMLMSFLGIGGMIFLAFLFNTSLMYLPYVVDNV
jgi:hypothetical protein